MTTPFFSDFNVITVDYTIKGDKTPIVENIVDLLQRVNLKISDKDKKQMCDDYLLPDGMTPEQAASILYNDPFLHWTILYINNIGSIISEWPMPEISLAAYVTKNYGAGKEYDSHHYEKMPERLVIDDQFCLDNYGYHAQIITNYDYEYELNEMKRFIKVVKPAYIDTFVGLFKNSLVA
jgi:hypothetical protein